MSSSKIIVLMSSDSEIFEIEQAVAMESQTIRHMIEDNCADSTIPLSDITSEILAKVIEYCKFHHEKPTKDEVKNFDADFVKVDRETLFDIMSAANFLNIKGLLELTCQTVANMMKGKTPEQIRKTFHIKNDFTPEEEDQIRRENSWLYQ